MAKNKVIDKIAWIHVVEKRLLSTKSKGKSVYYIPGGKREAGETDQGTLIREIKEELNVDIVPSSIKYFGAFTAQADSHPDGVQVQMTCYEAEYSGELKASAEIAEVVWVRYQDKDKCSPVDQLILEHLYKIGVV